MLVKYFIVILLSTISQVYCRWDKEGPTPWTNGDHLSIKGKGGEATFYCNEGIKTPIRLSRQKRGIEELRLLREAERDILKGLNYRNAEFDFEKVDPDFKRLYASDNDLIRLIESQSVDDQYKKVLLSKTRGGLNDDINKANKFGSLTNTDLPEDVKNYIINEYLNKRTFGEGRQFAQPGQDNLRGVPLGKADIEYDFKQIYIGGDKGNLGNFEKIRFKEDFRHRDLLADDVLKKEPYRKRMVEDKVKEGETSDQIQLLDDDINNLKALGKTLRIREEEMVGQQPITYMTTESIKDNHQIVIDLRDGSINIKERPNDQNDYKPGRNNDIRIKIKQDCPAENNNKASRPPEIKIVIKLPDKKENAKLIQHGQLESKTDKETINDVREEIKNYISLALSLLRKMEEEEYANDITKTSAS